MNWEKSKSAEPVWEARPPVDRRSRKLPATILASFALGGLGFALAACQDTLKQSTDAPFVDTGPRITGDSAVLVNLYVTPEGTAPTDTPITALDVTTADNLPTPVETTCKLPGGYDVELILKSGRKLVYYHCAMPEDIAIIRDAALIHGAEVASTGG